MRRYTKPCSEPGCSSRIFPRSQEGRTAPAPWCRRHEHKALEPYRDQLIEAVLERIEPDWETGCWNWVGSIVKSYGRFYGDEDTVGTWVAHRLTWHLFQAGHEKHQELDHRCNNPVCVCPLHLQAVSRSENNELRDRRRADPSHPWYPDDNPRAAEQNGWVFAMLKGLPWRNPVYNYSEAWSPTRLVETMLDAAWIKTVKLPERAKPSAIHPEQRKALINRGIGEGTIEDLELTQEEARKLLRPKRIKPRRSRRLTVSETRTKAR